ncbi:ABC transporter permease [Marinicellulosiphila megalodicopiae]|uniref:ABC transporter permease n=1 Tax=Marinicellulosiphila megalodicopiae TaxID=2724896 RepID=UPI003BB0DC12
MLFMLTIKSLKNRKLTVCLTLFMLISSVVLLLSVDRIRIDTRNSFANTISGTDLIIGARTSDINLLLYSVFRMGNATNNIGWDSYQEIIKQPQIKWSIPISLGDSHQGYKVIGTDNNYFKHFQYAQKNNLEFLEGEQFKHVFSVVLGSEVAQKLGYQLGDLISIAHGAGTTSFTNHDDKPFTVTGILKPTGTPVDQSLHVPLEGISAIHIDWSNGSKKSGLSISAQQALEMDLTPNSITSALIGLNSKMAIFSFQRDINEYPKEPLSAIIPATALAKLWQLIKAGESALFAVSIMVLITSLIAMTTVILSGLNERKREIAVLRAIGLPAKKILTLLICESTFYGVISIGIGYVIHVFSILLTQNWLQTHYGIQLHWMMPSNFMLITLTGFLLMSVLLGFIPGLKAYFNTLSDGLNPKI